LLTTRPQRTGGQQNRREIELVRGRRKGGGEREEGKEEERRREKKDI
jgi:hypothetical protein